MTDKLSRGIAFRVFLPFALGYFLSYFFRAVNAVIAPDLEVELGVGAADLGLLTSAYFLTFGLFQLPLGILLDRFGPRRVESCLLLIAAAGAVTFATATDIEGLIIGRAMIGLGVSACLMAAFKAYATWFPGPRLPMINMLQMTAGGCGALASTEPVEAALQFTDWRGVFFALAAATVAAAAILWCVVPRGRDPAKGETLKSQLAGVAAIWRSPVVQRVAPFCVASQATFLALTTLWSRAWFSDVAGMDRAASVEAQFILTASVVAGFLGTGFVVHQATRAGFTTIQVALTTMSVFLAAQAAILLSGGAYAVPLWIMLGLFGGSGILPYSALSQTFPPALAGRLNTALNFFAFLSVFAVQWGIGVIVALWPQAADGRYPPAAYATAFAAALCLQLAALFWLIIDRRAPLPRPLPA